MRWRLYTIDLLLIWEILRQIHREQTFLLTLFTWITHSYTDTQISRQPAQQHIDMVDKAEIKLTNLSPITYSVIWAVVACLLDPTTKAKTSIPTIIDELVLSTETPTKTEQEHKSCSLGDSLTKTSGRHNLALVLNLSPTIYRTKLYFLPYKGNPLHFFVPLPHVNYIFLALLS